MKTSSAYRNRLRRHYAPLVARHGGDHRAVDWGSARSQEARFRVLLEGGDFSTSRLLDVGCGVGHLVDHLKRRRFKGEYLGLDLVPEMISAARTRHPGWSFREESDLANAAGFRPDYVVGSGLFTFTDQRQLERTVAAMFALTRRTVAFNTLSAWASQPEADEFHADPAVVLEFCRTLTSRVVLRHDYLPHDFTVYLHREEASP
jgi:hypothetical protein